MNTSNLTLWFDFLKTFGPAVILPFLILWLSGRQNRKIKEVETDFELDKIKQSKIFERNLLSESEKKDHEKIVHSSLIKILFEVQKLHIALSGSCVDYKCIEEASSNFKDAFSKYQSIISDNQIYLSSKVTNNLYRFYKSLDELMIEINEIQYKKEYDMAIVAVYDYSRILAEDIISIQEEFIRKRKELNTDFNKIELTDFLGCCGRQPPKEQREKYYKLKNELNNLGEPIDVILEKV